MSPVYDSIFESKNYSLEVDQIFGLLPASMTEVNVLDIGCGTGNHAKFFLKKAKYDGVDINNEMIEKAKEKRINANFYAQSIEEYSLNNMSKYNLAVSLFSVVNHLLDVDSLFSFFEDIRTCLKPDSHFIFDCWNGYAAIRDHPKKEIREYEDKVLTIDPVFDPFEQTVNIDYNLRAQDLQDVIWSDKLKMTIWTPKVISDCLSSAGFQVKSISSGFGKQNLLDFAKPNDYKLLFHCGC